MQNDPSLALLSTAVRASYDCRARSELAGFSTNPLVDRLPALAARHRVEGLVWDGFYEAQVPLPARIAHQLQRRAQEVAAAHLVNIDQCRAIDMAFHSAGIPVMFIKGVTLAALAYPRPQAKESCDIDLLVAPCDLARANELLSQLGFSLALPPRPEALDRWHRLRKESVWIHRDADIQLDLHTRLLDNPSLSSRFNSPATRRVDVGHDCQLTTLSGPQLYAYLCAHGASSAWFRLKWLADLAALLAASDDAEVAELHEAAKYFGLGHASGQALLLLERYFAVPLPPALSQALQADRTTRWLAAAACRELTMTREPTQRPGGTMMIRLSQALVGGGPGYAIGELARQVREIVSRP